MSKNQTEGVRIGPISLATLIAVLLLAVLAVLCVTTSNATQSMAQRQADGITETYAADSVGQAVLAQVNEVIAGKSTADEAIAAVSQKLNSIKARAGAVNSDVSLNVYLAGQGVGFTASLESGKTLTGTIAFGNDGSASIESWKLSTTQTVDEETLWSGAGQKN